MNNVPRAVMSRPYPQPGQHGYVGQPGYLQPPRNYQENLQGNGNVGVRRSRGYSISGPPGTPLGPAFEPYRNPHQYIGDPRFPPGSDAGWLHNHRDMQLAPMGRPFAPQPMGNPIGGEGYERQNIQRALTSLGVDEPVRSMVYRQIPQPDHLPRRRFLDAPQVQDQWARPPTPARATQNTNPGSYHAAPPNFVGPLTVTAGPPMRPPVNPSYNPSNYSGRR